MDELEWAAEDPERAGRPFDQVLDALFGAESVAIALLYRLSDMTPAEMAIFRQRWAGVDDERRRVIARHLADLTETNFEIEFSPVFGILLNDPSSDVRKAALDGLWDSSDHRLVPVIIGLLQNDVDEEVQAAAASALAHYILMVEWGQVPARVHGPIVLALLGKYEAPDTAQPVRRAVLEALGASHDERIPDLIDAAYHGDDFPLQLSAVFAMGSSADPRWLPVILAELDSPREEMRAEAARAAGEIGRSASVAKLARLLRDDSYEVRVAAVGALGHIGSEEARELLDDLLNDPDGEELAEALVEALEEIDVLSGRLALDLLDWDETDDDEILGQGEEPAGPYPVA